MIENASFVDSDLLGAQRTVTGKPSYFTGGEFLNIKMVIYIHPSPYFKTSMSQGTDGKKGGSKFLILQMERLFK